MSDLFQELEPHRDSDRPIMRLDDDHGDSASMGVLDDDPPLEELVERAPIWLITFGDATALMLAFFVMLYSMSHLQSEQWDQIISVLSTREKPVEEGEPRPVGTRTVIKLDLVPAFETGYLQRILEEKLERDGVLSQIRITGLDKQLILSLPAGLMFDGDGAELSGAGQAVLSRLSVVIRQFGNRMDVQGHSSPLPPTDPAFADNWELTLGRALAVAQVLTSLGYPGDFSVFGLADSGYRFIDPAIPEAQRFELADRIDIVILPEARGQ